MEVQLRIKKMKNLEKIEKARAEYLIKEAELESIMMGVQTIKHPDLLVTVVFTKYHGTRIIFHIFNNFNNCSCVFKIEKGNSVFEHKTDDFSHDVKQCEDILKKWLAS